MKRFWVLLIAVAMVPLFMGILCPCAKASPSGKLAIGTAECHGCCPEMKASPECGSTIISQSFVSSSFESLGFSNVLKALRPHHKRDIAINRRALVPVVDEPFSHPQPLYLSLQVFRI